MTAVASSLSEIMAKIERKRRCIRQFIKLKCVKSGHEELDDDAHDFYIMLLDVRKMKNHILDCVAALGIVQQELVSHEQRYIREGEKSLAMETQEASNKVFKASLLTMATAMIHDGTEPSEQSASIDSLLRAFPDESKQSDGRSWLPLHWAVVAGETSVAEEDVKTVYTSDPMALQRYHQNERNIHGHTPAHLLCMQEMTQRNMSLIQYFSVCNQQAFTKIASYPDIGDSLSYSYSALHSACDLGQPTVELLKHLLQLDSSQTKKMCSEDGLTPLGYLCKNSSCSARLIACLLEVDSSAEVVGNGIAGCLKSTDYSCLLERVEMLLKANPEAAKYHDSDNDNLLHSAARQRKLPILLCIDIMQLIHAIHKDAVREVCSEGCLPIHCAAEYSTVELMEFLLGLYPESASVVTTVGSRSLLYLAVDDTNSTTSVIDAKVRFLCSQYPAMMLQMDKYGNTPLHDATTSQRNISAVQILCEAGGQDIIRLQVAHQTDANYVYNGWLPLHFLIYKQAGSLRESLLFKEADCFRMFLRLYPEAAGIEGGVVDDAVGEDEDDARSFKKTPYHLAVDKRLPPYYLRLLLRAAPDLNPTELHRLNYAERRMAMFLAFKAVTSQKKPVVLKRLCFENKDLVKHVISFL